MGCVMRCCCPKVMIMARNLKTRYFYNFTANVLPLTEYFIIREKGNVILYCSVGLRWTDLSK